MTQPDPTTPDPVAPAATDPAVPMSGPESWPEDARRKVAELNNENASWRTKYREAEPYVTRAQELEEAQKTEAQRAAEAHAAAEKRANDAEARLLRLEVAEAKGLTSKQAARLVGTTREELLADADDYLASLPTPAAPPAAARTPIEALRPGALPAPPEPSLDDQIAAAQKAGDVMAVIRLNNQKLAAQHAK